ncbi:4-hydroxythreonine-4-phosphate dehydrogenase [Roseivirga ehrenbergii]|uniref:4-hydroxythreonine-4-phosphate dehydrogenase n=1 Tax=Roseivirga ehrenbergii (strain DSM 102268 / JCM 13514 / KCTC 12282 / NCIMB 14502 / KMM 6017) TaxID=279360 RepID=A0A150XPC6_ROSEK|nr:4-hydroxythreonine-4-phosphate dehydrogenase PdxA [Roseivirga ehrenbergii]KYG80563.1 4-hydroxythreonine-4-phosphate dehydrogenase [Roseivirga ehrenbergii]TCL07808.1 4-hydroxythreonine-4-phosphate dehydrogenase [Roseivirga ehrenbergii]
MNLHSEDETTYKPVIGITIGDINGIGPEVIIKTISEQKLYDYATIILYGHGKAFSHYKKILDLTNFSFYQFNSGDRLHEKKANVINCWEEDFEIKPGEENSEGGKYALAALQKAVEDLQNGVIDGVVTAPISKNNIQSGDFNFPGHTEFFTTTFGAKDSLMFLCNDRLRIGVATGHIPLMKIKEELTTERLTSKIDLMLKSLKKDFGIIKPKVAILGLNPHAGEDGLLGSEEKELIQPVINEFKEKGHLVLGPYPADGFFGNNTNSQFDGILAMYHDQGLIPFKTIAFEDGVNFTAGLPIVRTSPDHGTAFGIAGKNEADPSSMRAALYMALDIIRNRRE